MELPADFGALTQALLAKAAAIGQPASGIFELTSRCNLACSMCYVREATAAYRELSSDAWLHLAREAAGQGMVFLLLTGGEVFLREDFWEIYEPIARMGLFLKVFTNATLITNQAAERLAACPPHLIEVTLYGASRRTYRALTGAAEAYDRCLAGLENLLRFGLPVLVKTTLTTLNVGELEGMRRMAERWGVPFQAGWLLTPRRDGRPTPIEHLRLEPDRVSGMEHAWNPADPAVEQPSEAASNTGAFYCQAGRNSFVITPSGDMNVCVDLPRPAARPLECGFLEAWRQVMRYADSVPVSAACSACGLAQSCPRCPAWSLLETGDLTAPVPYLCRLAAARERLRRRSSPCT
jgi:radical SAM protein with 4Fe4S-binding SPASM domain